MLPPVLQRIDTLGHEIFTGENYDLNLFGIRSAQIKSGDFDDWIGCAYRVRGEWRIHYWAATTDPGTYYLESPLNVKGTAILVPGQYRGVYGIGTHKSYEALTQQNGRVEVFRDRNRDRILDRDPDHVEEGYFGINIHASSSSPYEDNKESVEVNRWSAGCQVHATSEGFRDMMALAKLQIAETGVDTFTYTLIDDWPM